MEVEGAAADLGNADLGVGEEEEQFYERGVSSAVVRGGVLRDGFI